MYECVLFLNGDLLRDATHLTKLYVDDSRIHGIGDGVRFSTESTEGNQSFYVLMDYSCLERLSIKSAYFKWNKGQQSRGVSNTFHRRCLSDGSTPSGPSLAEKRLGGKCDYA